ncbi:hypothetical protein OPV22_025805 [Ensete ventricosum]|uniref:Syntaxin N-terminal domain-containing protein n=1 Tax=Ensete ventricosum TaxID=4639 RepID=A0AAV8QGG9_ENSVE|nr:hypothetical protein OPV22_025805 [Ensete ventricosum]
MAEARSLDAFRSALENLEDQLEFVHVIKSQQRAERDATTMRLGQSRDILARRLAEDEGKKHEENEKTFSRSDNSSRSSRLKHLDVLSARG